METSILDHFCAPLCEIVCSSHRDHGDCEINGADFITWLEHSNLFVVPLDAEGHWFRYHHLFQQLLQNQLENSVRPEAISALHTRASTWFAENGLIHEAVRHSLSTDNADRAVQLVEQNRHAMLDNDKWHVVDKWLSLFPEDVVQRRPELLMARAWGLYHRFAIAALPSVIDAVQSLVGDVSTDSTRAIARRWVIWYDMANPMWSS